MKTVFFGDQPPPGCVAAVMDGGTHGVQGHTIALGEDGGAKWERRIDSMAAVGTPGAGPLALDDAERRQLGAWFDVAWEMAGRGEGRHFGPITAGPPRWVWAVVVRRGAEIRVVEGGTAGSASGPALLQPLLAWLREKSGSAGTAI